MKNEKMLKALKENLFHYVVLYVKNKKREGRWIEEIKNELGICLMKIVELATLKYLTYRTAPELNIDEIRDAVMVGLWKTIEKIKIKKFNKPASAYNFLMIVAKQQAWEWIRKHLKRRKKIQFESLDTLVENNAPVLNKVSYTLD